MKIIFVGNANRKAAGARHFLYDTRIFNGLVRNGHSVHFFSDRDEARELSPLGLFKDLGRDRANRKLLETVDNLRPEALVLAHADVITAATLGEIRRRLPHLRVAQINVDPLFNPKNKANLLRRRDVVDATFVTTGGEVLKEVAGGGNTGYFIPNFSDSSIDTGRAFEQEPCDYDLACFMRVNPHKPADESGRYSLATGVAAALPELRPCFGGFAGKPVLLGQAYIEALGRSAMALSLSKHTSDGVPSTPQTRHLYSSDRIAHIMGNGALAFVEDDFSLQEIYAADEVVFFRDLAELIEKVRHYKANPAARQAIARKGWAKAHTEFNEKLVTRYVLERLFDRPLSRSYAWPTTGWRGA